MYRTMCEVLEEMRMLYKTRNFSGLLGLIEETQTMGNRMEAALYQVESLDQQHDEIKENKRVIKGLRKKKKKLERKINKLEKRNNV